MNTKNLKLYHFNPNNYDQQWFVVAESQERAKQYVNEYLINKHRKYQLRDEPCFHIDYWEDKRRGYTIDEYEVGEVIESEIA